MKKINLVYDGSMLLNQLQTGNRISRTGIFFVVYNVLKQFLDNPNLNVSVYTPRDSKILRQALDELYPEHKDVVIKNFNKKLKISSSYFMDVQSDSGFEEWNLPEKGGRWSKDISMISFDVDIDKVKNLTIDISVNSVLSSVKEVIIRNEYNGKIIKTFISSEARQGISFDIPREDIEGNKVSFCIESVGATSPEKLGMSADARILGIRIEKIFINTQKKNIKWSNGYLKYLQGTGVKIDKKYFLVYLKKRLLILFMKCFLKIKSIIESKREGLNDTDVFFSPCFAIPKEIAKNKKIQKYTILYDTLPYVTPKEYYPSHGWKFLFDLYKTLNKKDYYFCISENTKQDFLKYIKHLEKKKMKVALLAAADYFYKCDDKKRLQQVFEKYNLPKIDKYIFSLCTLDPRKNLVTPIRSFLKFIKKNNIKDLYFLLAGGHVSEYLAQIEDVLKEYPDQRNNIIQLGYIDDEDLAPFLSNAQWDVYTPFYEGFGLPPLEAMQCGCPVITSNNSSLPEVVGDAGILIDCTSDDEHVAAFEKYYFDEQFRKETADKGYERSKTFSWKKMSDIMVMEILKNAKN